MNIEQVAKRDDEWIPSLDFDLSTFCKKIDPGTIDNDGLSIEEVMEKPCVEFLTTVLGLDEDQIENDFKKRNGARHTTLSETFLVNLHIPVIKWLYSHVSPMSKPSVFCWFFFCVSLTFIRKKRRQKIERELLPLITIICF